MVIYLKLYRSWYLIEAKNILLEWEYQILINELFDF